MKKVMIWLSAAMVLFLYSSINAQVDTLTILHLNDTHSHLLSYGPKDGNGNWTWGGYARIATLIGMNRLTEPNVMLMHSGDLFVGDFMFQEYVGIAELEIMKALNFDALELGNHEFDLYPSTLEYVLNQAGFPGDGFPVLCANLDYSAEPQLGNFVSPYTIKEVGGVRVGIFGLLTDLTNQISNPSPAVVLPPLSVAQAWVDTLRIGHNCDVVILLSHMGVDYDQMTAANISGINVIVGGHSHTVISTPIQIGNTLILQAGEFGKYLGKLHLFVNNGAVQGWDYNLIPVDSSVPEEPTLAGMIGNLAVGIEADPRFGPVYSDVIASATTELTKPLSPGLVKDTPIGNLAADALREKTGTDIAFQPQGFISQTIYAGQIKASDVFQAFPYGFDQTSGLGLKLVTFQTDGMSLMAGLEFSVYNLPYVEDFLLQGSNISYVYNSTNPPGSRIDYSTIQINGQPVNPVGTYTATAPDAVIPFLSQIPGFNISNLQLTDYFDYSVAKDFIVAHSPVSYYSEGRLIDLASFQDPLAGVDALSNVITLFGTNGSINSPKAAKTLQHHLDVVTLHLQNGEMRAAVNGLEVFKTDVHRFNKQGVISASSSARLIFLAKALQQSIDPSLRKAVAEILPDNFVLSQNYPNPFNPQTQISFNLPTNANVMLSIYNILGENIRLLVDGHRNAGAQTVIWNGKDDRGQDVASGIYFYKLQSDNFSETKKMSLIR
jgi:5'-nucleotidase/UDP-sugar diphosphatase